MNDTHPPVLGKQPPLPGPALKARLTPRRCWPASPSAL